METLKKKLTDLYVSITFASHVYACSENSVKFAHHIVSEACSSGWSALELAVAWAPNDINTGAEYVRGWRNRCIKKNIFVLKMGPFFMDLMMDDEL